MSVIRTCIKCQEKFSKESFAFRSNGERTRRCIECLKSDDVPICPHDLIKELCNNCSEFCEHERDITTCKLCSDPIPITVRNMVHNNLQKDKQKGMFDVTNCVDEDHVLELIWKAQGSCYYCNCSMQYIYKQDNLASLERLTNSLGHVKGNCVISCLKCNRSGVGEKIVRRPAPKPVFGPKRAPLIPAVIQSKTESPLVQPVKKKAAAVPQLSHEEGAPALPTKKRRRSQVEEIEIFL